MVWCLNTRVSRAGWSTVRGCTHWTTILPSLDTTSSMWCWWFFSCCTSTGLSSYLECFTSSSSARCVFPRGFVFTDLMRCMHIYGSPSPRPVFCSWKVMTGVTKRRMTVTHPETKNWVTKMVLESEVGPMATDPHWQQRTSVDFIWKCC